MLRKPDSYGDGPALSAALAGTILFARATLPATGTSDWSDPVIVGNAMALLRTDALTSLTQPIGPLFSRIFGHDPALEPVGNNLIPNWGEGGNPQLPGSGDDDKAYILLLNPTSPFTDPDPTVLTDNGRPLVFYELLDNDTCTLFVTKSGGMIQISFTQ